MSLSIRYLTGVHPDLKREVIYFAKWLRVHYAFPKPLEIKLVPKDVLIDFDGVKCNLRWWQRSNGVQSVKGEIAVKSFEETLKNEGSETAYPTVIAAIARVIKYYSLALKDMPSDEDIATEWGDKVLDAYFDERSPPDA